MKHTRERLLFLLIITLPSLIGCGPIITFNKYTPPDLPKSELATLQIGTTGMRIQQVGMEVEIDGKLAVRKKIKDNKNISIDDIYVVPGTHNLSARSITYYLDPHSLYRNKHRVYIQTTVTLSAELKADRTYIVKANLHPDITGVFSIEVVDKKIGKVVSRNLNTHFKYKYKAVSTE
jgi:hypothetical protein